MVLKILLVISIILQLFAALVAMRLTRVTKYNLSWILISTALTLMIAQRIAEFVQTSGKEIEISEEIYVWIGVVTSLCFAAGVFLIREIFNYTANREEKRRMYEKRILNAIIQTEEKERQRFSKEIHDGIGPLLSSAKMSVSMLAKLNSQTEHKAVIDNISTVIEESIKSAKEISNNLNPHILMNFGLIRALDNFIKKISVSHTVKINFDTNLRNIRLDQDLEVILYRVACEMINNSLKHADASVINLNIEKNGDIVSILFEDNGRGFIPEEVIDVAGGGMGLSNIVSRIGSVKGIVDIISAPGSGTKITVNVNSKELWKQGNATSS
ncbi:MAG: histidine kinase [Rikenellaceae bacterium]|nr:histidine kinase [Rikenellaceae bacterium]